MTWRDYLTDAELERLERLEVLRDQAREAYSAERRLLKSRAESRMRQEAKRERDARYGSPDNPKQSKEASGADKRP